ncbi:hypothetical protein PR048_029132 [Dryococelus australis]|uniref:Uncharacterized protein n=1 Tax=Dryococelus australis TaxID=614101 RepID=A0ABQ9GCH6_9NEOP|nr:hypothetical protein PR048_029132 [Dryococelus australis]
MEENMTLVIQGHGKGSRSSWVKVKVTPIQYGGLVMSFKAGGWRPAPLPHPLVIIWSQTTCDIMATTFIPKVFLYLPESEDEIVVTMPRRKYVSPDFSREGPLNDHKLPFSGPVHHSVTMIPGNGVFSGYCEIPKACWRQCTAHQLHCHEQRPNKAFSTSRVQSPAGSPDFRKWESCRTMPLVGGFLSGISRFPSSLFRRRSIFTSLTLIGSQVLAVKSRPNVFTSTTYRFSALSLSS